MNIEHATGFGDQVVDCSCADPGPGGEDQAEEDDGFQRTGRCDQGQAWGALAALAG